MDESAELPIEFDGSLDPAHLPDITLGKSCYDPNTPNKGKPSHGRISPVRGRTMKEYDQQISELKKENFSLKMRIYYMEERMNQRYGDGQDVFKTNIELQVEIENLKKDLNDKQIIVNKAALAMETLTTNQKTAEETMRSRIMAEQREVMDGLRDQLNDQMKDCAKYLQEEESSRRRVEQLGRQLDDTDRELTKARREGEEMNNRVKNTEFDLQTLTAQLRLSQQAGADKDKEMVSLRSRLGQLDVQLKDSEKLVSRRDRDMVNHAQFNCRRNLSQLLDQSQIDGTALLEPQHLKDDLDDHKEKLGRQAEAMGHMKACLDTKDDIIGKLEDALREMEDSKKTADKAREESQKELNIKLKVLNNYKKMVEDLMKDCHSKDKELKKERHKIQETKGEVTNLQETIREAEIEKAKNLIKSLGKKEGELAGFQDQLRKAMEALNRSEEAVEALQSQLKTERGEFELKLKEQALHFQMSLNKATGPGMELEGLRGQIGELQTLIAGQNVELLAVAREKEDWAKVRERLRDREKDIQLLSTEHKAELADLERDIAALKAESRGKDLTIESLKKHVTWLEDFHRGAARGLHPDSNTTNTNHMHTFNHSFHHNLDGLKIPVSSNDLLQDLKKLMEALRRDVGSLSVLQPHLIGEGLNADILLSEIQSVQSIYKQLEEGVQKNSQIHQTLLHSLRPDNRQSDSPDSNSCQDGGYNLISPRHSSQPTTETQTCQADSTDTGSRSLEVCSSTDVTDRSLQAGPAHDQVDQCIQTTPRSDRSEVNTSQRSDKGQDWQDHRRTTVQRGSPPGILRQGGGSGSNKVTFIDPHQPDTNTSHDSITDDLKGQRQQQPHHPGHNSDDYLHFRHGIFDDHYHDDHFDYRHQDTDRASSVRPDSRANSRPTSEYNSHPHPEYSQREDSRGHSEYIDLPSIQGSKTDRSPGCQGNSSSTPRQAPGSPEGKGQGSTSFSLDLSGKEPHLLKTGAQSKDLSSPSQRSNFTKNIRSGNRSFNKDSSIGDCSDNSKEKSYNNHSNTETLTPNRGYNNSFDNRDVSYNSNRISNRDASYDKSSDRDVSFHNSNDRSGNHALSSPANRSRQASNLGLDNLSQVGEEDRGDRQSRRSSAAEDLPLYRVTGPRTPQTPITPTMSASDLRDLVAQLQVDLVEAVKNNNRLQHELDTQGLVSAVGKINGGDVSGLYGRSNSLNLNGSMNSSSSKRGVLYGENNINRNSNGLNNTHKEKTSGINGLSKDMIGRVSRGQAYEEDGQPLVPGQKGLIPSLHRAGSLASSCSTSEDSDCYSARDSDKVANGGSSSQEEIRRRRSLSSDRGSSVHQQLSHTKSQIKELSDKLSATENTVRLLSRKNKTYLSVLEQAGLATEKLRRSSSETCLYGSPEGHSHRSGSSSPGHMAKMRRASRSGSVGALDVMAGGDHAGVEFSRRLSRSPSKQRQALPSYSGESIEVGRTTALDFSTIMSTRSMSPVKGSLINGSRPPSASDSNSSPPTPLHRQGKSPHWSPSGTDNTACHDGNGYTDTTDTSCWDQTSRMDQTSRLEQTSSYDMTMHSFINSPIKVRKTLGALAEDRHNSTMAGLSKDQLQTRIQHLEHVNVTLREEMRLLERLTSKMSPAPSKTNLQDTATEEGVSVGVGISLHINDNEEELLRQHLAEIRRLRQRLEKLDVEKDPDQLLIFQTHFQTQIHRQETIISQLTTQLREQQETWQRELLETQQRMTRERNTRVEEMQHTLTQMEKNISTQQAHIQELTTKEETAASTVSDMADRLTSCRREREEEVTQMKQERSQMQAQMSKKNAEFVQMEDTLMGLEQRLADGGGQIANLKQHLQTAEQRERRKEEEVKTLISDKTELQADLIKRDRDFLELEESVFKLELAKENAEKDRGRWEEEVQEREKEAGGLRREIDEYKESSRCLKEIVVKRERSLQEKVQTLNRLTKDKAGSDKRVTQQADQLKQLEEELGALRQEVQEHRHWKEECTMMKEDREREEAERKKMTQTLTERETKLQKRDKQVQHVVEQYKKLEAAYFKMRTALKQKNDTIKSKERQVEYLDAMATCSSQEEKNTLMKELVKELVATQKQVEDLLGRMEGGGAAPIPTVRVETASSSAASPGGISTSTTITTSPSMHRGDSFISLGASDGLPDPPPCTPPPHGTPTPLAPVSLNEPSLCTPYKSPYKPDVSNVTDIMSPGKLTYLADNDTPLPQTGSVNQFGAINSELRSLFAVFKLQSQETLRKQAGEALVTLSGLEVRVADRMKVLKAKPMAESIEYSTLRETSLGLANLRVCVQEVCRLAATAWVTELPPLDSRGQFFDPKLDSENQGLQRDLTRMMSRNDVLEHTIRQQQSRLDTNKERQKNWEASMYRQLFKTTTDLEQAKENIDSAAGHRITTASDRHHRTDYTHNSSTFTNQHTNQHTSHNQHSSFNSPHNNHMGNSSGTYNNNHMSNSNNGYARGSSPLRQTFFDNSDNL